MITMRSIRDVVDAAVRPLRERLRGAIVRGVVKVLSDGAGLQRVQVSATADEVSDDVEVICAPGFTARPAAGVEALLLSVGGNPAHRVALLFDRQTRYKGELAVGEAAMYIGHGAQVILLKASGDIVIVPKSGSDVKLGAAAATKHVALAEDVQARFDVLKAAINAWTPVPNDGGAALKLALTTWLAGSNAVGSDNVKAMG